MEWLKEHVMIFLAVFSAITATITVGGVIFYIGRWVGGVNADRGDFKRFLDEVRKDIGGIRGQLERRTDEPTTQIIREYIGGDAP